METLRSAIVNEIMFYIIQNQLWKEEDSKLLAVYFHLFIQNGETFILRFGGNYTITLSMDWSVNYEKEIVTSHS